MVAAGVLVEGREIRLGALTFIADDSAWLQEAPLDVDALPVRGAATVASAMAWEREGEELGANGGVQEGRGATER